GEHAAVSRAIDRSSGWVHESIAPCRCLRRWARYQGRYRWGNRGVLADGGDERTQAPVALDAAVPSKVGIIWSRRRILLLLVGRDLKVKYAGSALGYFWSVL